MSYSEISEQVAAAEVAYKAVLRNIESEICVLSEYFSGEDRPDADFILTHARNLVQHAEEAELLTRYSFADAAVAS